MTPSSRLVRGWSERYPLLQQAAMVGAGQLARHHREKHQFLTAADSGQLSDQIIRPIQRRTVLPVVGQDEDSSALQRWSAI